MYIEWKGGINRMGIKDIIILIFIFVVIAGVVLWAFHRKRRNEKIELAKNDMLEHFLDFTGYYQVLYDAVTSGDANTVGKILDVWKKRMEGIPHLQVLFLRIAHNKKGKCYAGRKWLDTLYTWGIIQDNHSEFSISETNQNFYLFDDVYEIGDIAVIIKPAWIYKDGTILKCIEQGTARVKE